RKTSSHEQHVAWLDAHTLLGFGGVEVFGEYWLAALEPRQTTQARDVQKNAATHDAATGQLDRTYRCALACGDQPCCLAVVERPWPGRIDSHVAVRGRIQVGHRDAVRLQQKRVSCACATC